MLKWINIIFSLTLTECEQTTNCGLTFQGQEYTTKYRLEYQREDDGRWFRYKNHNSSEVRLYDITYHVFIINDQRLLCSLHVLCKVPCVRVMLSRTSVKQMLKYSCFSDTHLSYASLSVPVVLNF